MEIIETQSAAIPPEVEHFVIRGGAAARDEVQRKERAAEVPILLYHTIADDGPAEFSPYRVAPAAFQQQMRFLHEHGYHSISVNEWAGCIAWRFRVPGRPVIITFDNGCTDFIAHAAPVLESFDFRATVFIATNLVRETDERDADIASGRSLPPMSWGGLRDLQRRGFGIGSRTTSHVDLLRLSDEEIIRDGVEAREALRKNLSRDVTSIAFPSGQNDARVRAALMQAGYRIGLRAGGGRSTLDDDPIHLPRIEIVGQDDLDAFVLRLETKGDGATHRDAIHGGARQSDSPNPDLECFGPLFDASWYLARNPDVAAAGLNPLAHYLESGIAERREPNPLFDTQWYLGQHARFIAREVQERANGRTALGRSHAEPARASLLRRAADRMLGSLRTRPPFRQESASAGKMRRNRLWRRSQTQPMSLVARPTAPQAGSTIAPARAELNPLAHYLSVGTAEGRDPHPLFDTDWYVARNPDVSELGMNPLAHFLTIGVREGRAPHPIFNDDWSLAGDFIEAPMVAPSAWLGARPGSPLVSVIIPVFNKARYLRECLLSTLAQSLENLEVICVDDCSTDESPEILEEIAKIDPRVSVVRTATNSGAGPARNLGIRLARGRFIQFTDADDVLPTDALKTLYELATTDHAQLVKGNLRIIRGISDSVYSFVESPFPELRCGRRSNARFSDASDLWTPWGHQAFLIELSFLREVGGRYPSLSDGQDCVFISTLLVNAKSISTTSQITYFYRVADGARRSHLINYVDSARHVAIVRRLYLDHCREAWSYGYRPFLMSNRFFIEHTSGIERDIMDVVITKAGVGA